MEMLPSIIGKPTVCL